MSRWLGSAAAEKAKSITTLAPPSVQTVVDIGAGTGAVLAALDRQGFAESYWACEPSRELADQMPTMSRLVDTEIGRFEDSFQGRHFDLAILSHVLEHVRAPGALLTHVLDRASHVIVELPIEASILTRVRTRGRDLSRDHPAGHIHFFNERDARTLVAVAGGEILAERRYFPLAPYRLQAHRWEQRLLLGLATRAEFLARTHYEHFALLVAARRFNDWDHHYPAPF